MSIRTAIACAAVAFTQTAHSNGLEYIMVYRCNATALNVKLVEVCLANHPKLRQTAETAFANWNSRFGKRASRAVQKCPADIAQVTETAELREKMYALISERLGKMNNQLETQAADTDGAFCRNALGQMGGERGYFDAMLEK